VSSSGDRLEAFLAGEAGERCNGMMLYGSEVAVRRDGLKRWTIVLRPLGSGPETRPTDDAEARKLDLVLGHPAAQSAQVAGETTLLCESWRQCRSFRFALTHATSRLAEQMHAEQQLVQGAAEAERARAAKLAASSGMSEAEAAEQARREGEGERAAAMARLAEQQRAQDRALAEAAGDSEARRAEADAARRRRLREASLARAKAPLGAAGLEEKALWVHCFVGEPTSLAETAAIRLVPDETAQTLVGRACAALGVAPKPKFEATLRGRLRSAALPSRAARLEAGGSLQEAGEAAAVVSALCRRVGGPLTRLIPMELIRGELEKRLTPSMSSDQRAAETELYQREFQNRYFELHIPAEAVLSRSGESILLALAPNPALASEPALRDSSPQAEIALTLNVHGDALGDDETLSVRVSSVRFLPRVAEGGGEDVGPKAASGLTCRVRVDGDH
jgi:hypothetical protein